MAPEKRYHVRWDNYVAIEVFEPRVEDSGIYCVHCFLLYGYGNIKINGFKKKFYCKLNYFQFVEFTFKL